MAIAKGRQSVAALKKKIADLEAENSTLAEDLEATEEERDDLRDRLIAAKVALNIEEDEESDEDDEEGDEDEGDDSDEDDEDDEE